MINNFEVIENFLNYDSESYYKFEALIRNTDGDNSLFYSGQSNADKNMLIKSWYIDSIERYNKKKHEMIELCNLTGARLYVTLDKKSIKNTLIEVYRKYNDMVADALCGTKYQIKTITRQVDSVTSVKDTSIHGTRTIMFDVDCREDILVEVIKNYIEKQKQQAYILETRQGYHIFCYKKFNTETWKSDIVNEYCKTHRDIEDVQNLVHLIKDVQVKDNQLGLVYHPQKEN